jgi:hypothetical protein
MARPDLEAHAGEPRCRDQDRPSRQGNPLRLPRVVPQPSPARWREPAGGRGLGRSLTTGVVPQLRQRDRRVGGRATPLGGEDQARLGRRPRALRPGSQSLGFRPLREPDAERPGQRQGLDHLVRARRRGPHARLTRARPAPGEPPHPRPDRSWPPGSPGSGAPRSLAHSYLHLVRRGQAHGDVWSDAERASFVRSAACLTGLALPAMVQGRPYVADHHRANDAAMNAPVLLAEDNTDSPPAHPAPARGGRLGRNPSVRRPRRPGPWYPRCCDPAL